MTTSSAVYHTYVFEMLLVLNICLVQVLTVVLASFPFRERKNSIRVIYKEDGCNNAVARHD